MKAVALLVREGWAQGVRSMFAARIFLSALLGCVVATSSGAVFENHCAACHGMDGKARTPAGRKLGAKDLSMSKRLDGEIERQILEGVKDARGASKMPAFKEKLSAAEVALLVSYAKSFRAR